MIGIVGPREPSSYADQVVQVCFRALANYDVVTISGFARGVDQLVHRYSLQHKIPTVVVLG